MRMRIRQSLLALLAVGVCGSAAAHDFWLTGNNERTFTGTIGYGHGFPKPDPIPDSRLKLFTPLMVFKKDGSQTTLARTSPSYQHEGPQLPGGSYILAGQYKPTFWSKDTQNKWHMDGTRQTVQNVASCSLTSMNAKAIIQIGQTQDAFVTQPSGQPLEIVPLTHPASFKAEQPFKVQVLANGQPVKRALVVGTFDGFLKDKHAFSGTTDLQGVIEVVALKPGLWMLKATQAQPYHDTTVCDEVKNYATLTFNVKP
ncbi:MAG: DUF4198 domain-containing protein [Brachymonas sp.]|nr:DUF4198 domain-containing protein [Brachymonas sp.]